MSHKDLIRAYYQACLNHDVEEQRRLFEQSIKKILKKKEKGKKVSKPKYTVIRG